MRDLVALAVMARAPSDAGGKTRLLSALGTDDGAGLRRALLVDTIDLARSVAGVETILLFTPDSSLGEFASLVDPSTRLVAQSGADLGGRLEHAFADLFAAGSAAVTIIGSDLPTLPAAYLERAVETLMRHDDPLVLGPAEDGGYYLIGLRSSHPEMFRGIPWSTSRVLAATLASADAHGLPVTLLPSWYDVDTIDDLRRAIGSSDAGPSAARHTRAWATAHESLLTSG